MFYSMLHLLYDTQNNEYTNGHCIPHCILYGFFHIFSNNLPNYIAYRCRTLGKNFTSRSVTLRRVLVVVVVVVAYE